MQTEELVLKCIKESNKDRSKTMAEFIALIFTGKFIEIYMGDSYEEVSTEQISVSYPAVFCGKVVGAFKECLILDSAFVDPQNRKLRLGNLLFLNERGIRGMCEIDGNGILEDMFLRSKESLDIKATFIDK